MAFWRVLEGYTNDGTPHITQLKISRDRGLMTPLTLLMLHRIRIVTLA